MRRMGKASWVVIALDILIMIKWKKGLFKKSEMSISGIKAAVFSACFG